MKKTINAENWVDDKITYSLEGNQLTVYDETFTVDKELLKDGSHAYRIKDIEIVAYDLEGTYYAHSDMAQGVIRSSEDPIDAIVKVISNVL